MQGQEDGFDSIPERRGRLTVFDRLAANFFGIASVDVPRLPRGDWESHRAVVRFVVLLVLPVSAVSFGHLGTLLFPATGGVGSFSEQQLFWASAIGGATFGVVVTWLNDSGMTIMVRRPGSSWQKAIGVAARAAFIALNVGLFTAAITAFALRNKIEEQRGEDRKAAVKRDTGPVQEAADRDQKRLGDLQVIRDDAGKAAKGAAASAEIAAAESEDCDKRESTESRAAISARKRAEWLASVPDSKTAPDPDRPRRLREARDEQRRTQQKFEKTQETCKQLAAALKVAKDRRVESEAAFETSKKEAEQGRAILDRALARADAVSTSASVQAGLAHGRNIAAEFTTLSKVLQQSSSDEARLIAAVVAALFALIDVMPLIWGWSLRDGEVDRFVAEQRKAYLARLEQVSDDVLLDIDLASLSHRQALDARVQHETILRKGKVKLESEIAAAKLYADAVEDLERVLSAEQYLGVPEASLQRVREAAMTSLAETFAALRGTAAEA